MIDPPLKNSEFFEKKVSEEQTFLTVAICIFITMKIKVLALLKNKS